MQAAFWDERAAKYDEDIRKHDSLYEKTIRSTQSLLTHSDVVLDFGCASGEFSLAIASSVQRVHGIDVSSNMIDLATEKARDRSAENVTFDTTELFDLPLAPHDYTAILAFNVFHLVEDISAVLGRISRLLPAGGLLFSQTPCLGERGCLFKLFVGFAQKVKTAPPIRSLTFAELASLVSSSGFEILESEVWDEKDAVQRVVARKPA
jgi:ubiquinone/menaquinone biosynthesis C-methylase UbiE